MGLHNRRQKMAWPTVAVGFEKGSAVVVEGGEEGAGTGWGTPKLPQRWLRPSGCMRPWHTVQRVQKPQAGRLTAPAGCMWIPGLRTVQTARTT